MTAKKDLKSQFPPESQHLIVTDPEEKKAHFESFDAFKKYCKDTMVYPGHESPNLWFQEIMMVEEWLFKYHRYEIWVGDALRKYPGIVYKIYTRNILLYSLFGEYPGRKALLTDIFKCLDDPDMQMNKAKDYYEYRKSSGTLSPEANALWTLWNDINIHFKSKWFNLKLQKMRLDHVALNYKMFYGLSMKYEENLMAGQEMTSSKPAEEWMSSMQNMYKLLRQ